MTDEEKAIERYCKTCKKKNNCFHNCDVFIEYTKGLVEGRNSYLGCETSMNQNYMFMYSVLLKENAKLKDKLNLQNQRLNELKKENEELKEQNKTILEDNDTLNEWIDELKAQNENKREEIKMLRNEHKQDMVIHNNYVNKVSELKMQIENYKLSENESKEIIAELNRDKTELVNSVTELKNKVTELEEQLKNNPYVQILQKEKSEMAEDFAKQIEKMKCCENCNKYKKGKCTEDKMFWARTTKQCKDWEIVE